MSFGRSARASGWRHRRRVVRAQVEKGHGRRACIFCKKPFFPLLPCQDLEASAWLSPIQVLKEIILYSRTSSHLVIERRGKEGRARAERDHVRRPHERPSCRIELVRWRPGQAGHAYGPGELDRPSDDVSKMLVRAQHRPRVQRIPPTDRALRPFLLLPLSPLPSPAPKCTAGSESAMSSSRRPSRKGPAYPTCPATRRAGGSTIESRGRAEKESKRAGALRGDR
jgi:hypothetical protein